MRDSLEKWLLETGKIKINGSTSSRAGNVSNLCFMDFDGKALMTIYVKIWLFGRFSLLKCPAEPSHVLKAMG